jgi:hypothetical protein
MRSITTLWAVLALSACASGPLDQTGTFLPPEHARQLEAARPCCASFREISFEKLSLGEEKAFTLTPSSPVYQFPHGRSFFAAHELPADARTLLVKTVPVNMLYNPVGHVLIPGVIFLNQDRELSGAVRPVFVPRLPRVIGVSWAEAPVPIPANARFAIVVDGKSGGDLAWRDSDQRSGYLHVRAGPTGAGSVTASAE